MLNLRVRVLLSRINNFISGQFGPIRNPADQKLTTLTISGHYMKTIALSFQPSVFTTLRIECDCSRSTFRHRNDGDFVLASVLELEFNPVSTAVHLRYFSLE